MSSENDTSIVIQQNSTVFDNAITTKFRGEIMFSSTWNRLWEMHDQVKDMFVFSLNRILLK